MFAIDPKGYARPFTVEGELAPEEGWTVLSLFSPRPSEPRHP
jgi:hypothetical protein